MSLLTKLSSRMDGVEPSPTVRLNAVAQEMIKSGKDVINLTAGETDFETSDLVVKAAVTALEKGLTKYSSPQGTVELRKAVSNWMQTDFGLSYEASQVTVTAGVKQGIFHLILATVSPGDEVLIPSPYWVSYPEMVRLAGGVPVFLPPDSDFTLSPDTLRKAINGKSRLLLLNYPNNPTGAMMRRDDLRACAKVLEGTDVLVASDEIYSSLVYDGMPFTSFASLSEDAYRRTITFNGLSKSHAMTGWRVGFACGNSNLIEAMGILQAQSATHIPTFIQPAAIEALKQSVEAFAPRLTEMKKRRDFVVARLQSIPGIQLTSPPGAFYVFPRMTDIMTKKGFDSVSLAEYLLTKAGVAVVPGRPFGDDQCIRLSFAKDLKSLEKAMDRLAVALQNGGT